MPTWIFGYGSLIWKPNLPFIEERWARLFGWERRFWQGSPDHRGTPERPGRVLTLTENAKSLCWGKVFLLDPSQEEATLAKLNHREKAGYETRIVEVHTEQGPIQAWLYIGLPDNPHFLGPADTPDMARHISASQGPSGTNRDYVLELANALGPRLSPETDPELFALTAALRLNG